MNAEKKEIRMKTKARQGMGLRLGSEVQTDSGRRENKFNSTDMPQKTGNGIHN